MADRYDKILEKFFTGGLDLEIKMREQELRHPQSEADENIGGGRAQNKRSYSVENTMIKIDSDDKLNELKRQRDVIEACMGLCNDEHKEVFYEHYRNRMSWTNIAQVHHIDESTARRWRDELKDLCDRFSLLEKQV
ncbi:DUF722 domain-containing protein [Weissella minor]|uniref:DUF722 domain-containing protein n=1 Tax=Weissella minor TaxID=1620 RepID=UPI001BAF1A10|nr:DUF722 domain-containing protein [Weissella minor]MBS0950563.1 DUF722 domain-containing protein [Weissella minor]